MLVFCQGVSNCLDVQRQVWLHLLQSQESHVAELVELLKEEFEILWVLSLALRQVQRLDHFVLHKDELDDLAFDLTDKDSSHLEDLQAASLIQNRLTHVVERTIVEDNVANVQLPDCT